MATYGWLELDRFLRAQRVRIGAPTTGQTDGGDHTATSKHYPRNNAVSPDGLRHGCARDYGSASSDCAAIFRALLPHAKSGVVIELFYDPLGGWDNGTNIGPIGGHGDHVHAAIRPAGQLPGSPQEDDMAFSREELKQIIREAVDEREDARAKDIKIHDEEIRQQILANDQRAEREEDAVQVEMRDLLRKIAAKVGA